MKNSILCEPLKINEKEFLLASIVNEKGCIGICQTAGTLKTKCSSFFIGSEALISISLPDNADDYTDKIIWQTSSIDKCKNVINSRFTTCVENYFQHSYEMSRAIRPVLEMMSSGLYVIHLEKMLPTDGCSGFFWNSFCTKHEYPCSSTLIRNIGAEKGFSPCFLVPTENYGNYSESRMQISVEKAKAGFRLGGIAYHLTGMYSALLDGHSNALASLLTDNEFYCILIEPVSNVVIEGDCAVALSCPYVNIPVSKISRGMMENFLMTRRMSFPPNYAEINAKSSKTMKNLARPHYLSPTLIRKTEELPDADMISSSYAVGELTDAELEALLRGETKLNDKIIISANYYESLVTACNYLHYTDYKRFISFVEGILANPELTATHKYIVSKLQYIMKQEVYNIFVSIISGTDGVYAPLLDSAKKYISAYEEYVADASAPEAQAHTPEPSGKKVYSSAILANEIERAGIK